MASNRMSIGRDGIYRAGFSNVPFMVITDPELSDGEVRLYAYLCRKAAQSDELEITQSDIAKDLGRHRTNIIKMLNRLIDTGYVISIRQGQGKPNKYILVTFPRHIFPEQFEAIYAPHIAHSEGNGHNMQMSRNRYIKMSRNRYIKMSQNRDITHNSINSTTKTHTDSTVPDQSLAVEQTDFVCVCVEKLSVCKNPPRDVEAFVIKLIDIHSIEDLSELVSACSIAAHEESKGRIRSAFALLRSDAAFDQGQCTVQPGDDYDRDRRAAVRESVVEKLLKLDRPLSNEEYLQLNGHKNQFVELYDLDVLETSGDFKAAGQGLFVRKKDVERFNPGQTDVVSGAAREFLKEMRANI